MKKIKTRLLNAFYNLKKNNDGMGVIELVLIILVIVGLIIIFRDQITSIINIVFSKVTDQINEF